VAHSADIYKADNTTALDQAESWTGGTAPGTNDTAVYTGLGALSTALGSDQSWAGISATDNSGIWTITGSETLTIGAGGITTGSGTSGGLKVSSEVHQSADAVYNVGTGRSVTFNGSLSGSGAIEKSTGGGALILVDDNSAYSGTITHSAGLIAVSGDSALGSGTLVLNGGKLNAYPSSATVANSITLDADSTLQAVNTSRNLSLTGVISGDAGVVLSGAGELTLSGNNTFAGGVWLGADATMLIVSNNNALGTGTLTVNGSDGQIGAASLVSVANAVSLDADLEVVDAGGNMFLTGALSGSGTLTKSGARVLVLSGESTEFSGDTVVNGGVLSVGNNNALGTGMLSLTGGTVNAYSTDRELANDVVVSAASTLEAVTTSRNLTLSGTISGDAALTIRGSGAVTLSGANTFSGGTVLGLSSGSTLIAGHDDALGTGALTVSGNSGMLSVTENLTLANAVSLEADLDVISASVISLSGLISGSGSLLKTGNGNLVLSGDNSGFSGTISHSAGVISVGHNNGLGTGVLTLNGGKLNAYSIDRTLANSIVVADDSTFETVNATRDLTLTGVISGSGAVAKTGTGTLTLTGANTYTNTTTVSVGELVVDGSLASSLVTVDAGTGLGGTGTVQSVTMLSGSTLGVTDSTGALTFNGDATFDSGSTVMLEIPSAGSYDLLQGNGANTLDVSTDFIFDFSDNTTVAADDTFTVLQNWGSVVDGGITYSAMGLADGLSVDASQLAIDGSVSVITSEVAVVTQAEGMMYAGFYTGEEGETGIYTFTDPTRPFETATRVGTVASPATTYQSTGYDGETFITINRSNGKLYQNSGSSVSFNLISSTYSYSDWHGVDRCNDVYYGIYDGSSIEGAGLYLFADPEDPENTCVKICTNQTFSSDTWTDVAFDGERYLFVRTDADGGTAGIYQYDPDEDTFSLISGSETYADWEGLAVFDSDIAPLLNKKVYLLLFGGQSNALGWGYHQYLLDNDSPLQYEQEDIDFLYRKPYSSAGMLAENTLLPLQSGNSNTQVKDLPNEYPELTNAPISRFGPEMSFARTVRDRISVPNSEVAVMKFAYGGSGLYTTDQWWPDGTDDRADDGTLYRIFQQTAWRAIAALKNKYPTHELEVLGMGWVQGESDAMNDAADEYEENLTRFITDIRATFGTNITFTLSKLSSNQSTSDEWETVKVAQQAVADADANVVATSTEGTNYLTSVGLSEGQLHYKTPSLLQIGEDLGNALFETCGLDSDEDGLPDAWELE
jgi:autotransporter-associated beta strand protein